MLEYEVIEFKWIKEDMNYETTVVRVQQKNCDEEPRVVRLSYKPRIGQYIKLKG